MRTLPCLKNIWDTCSACHVVCKQVLAILNSIARERRIKDTAKKCERRIKDYKDYKVWCKYCF